MSKKLTTGADFCKSQARNMVIHKVSALPATNVSVPGQIVYLEDDFHLYFYGEGGWIQLPIIASDLQLGNVINVAQIPQSYLDPDAALTANSNAKVATQRATKQYVDSVASYILGQATTGLVYKGIFDGTKTIAANGITAITKGWFWKVNPGGTASGIHSPTGLTPGDMLIANATKSSGITAADFDYVPELMSADVVLLTAVQTLTNKTIDAAHNTISNIGFNQMDPLFINNDESLALQGNGYDEIPSVAAVISYVANQIYQSKNPYTANINNLASGTITAATHEKGVNVIVRLYETVNNVRTEIEADISLNDAGDVSWSTTTPITGQIIITR